MGNSVNLHLSYILPDQSETPRIANTVKKNTARIRTPPSYATDARSVDMSIFIDGIVVRLLRGLINLKVLIPLTDVICGIAVSNELTTTMKSSQFQASLK